MGMEYYDVILRPVVTEKSMADMADKKYTFIVHPDATKPMIKNAVEKMFDGTVDNEHRRKDKTQEFKERCYRRAHGIKEEGGS